VRAKGVHAYPVGPCPAVHVLVVVAVGIERRERLASLLRAAAEEGVEHLLPGGGMELGRIGEHAVEIE
jgi:hypothetical protein